jgi:hypothetical protein
MIAAVLRHQVSTPLLGVYLAIEPYARINLVRGIFPNHMPDGQVPSRMVLHPPVGLDDLVMEDEHMASFGDESFNLVASEDWRVALGCIWGWRWEARDASCNWIRHERDYGFIVK